MQKELENRFKELCNIDEKYIDKIHMLQNLINKGYIIKKLTLKSNIGIYIEKNLESNDQDLGILHRERKLLFLTKYGDISSYMLDS